MAKAIATYKCPDCGATIERRIAGFNRRDADSKKISIHAPRTGSDRAK